MEIISIDKLDQAIYDYNHKNYSVSDNDIRYINDIIVKGFAEVYRLHGSNVKRICIDNSIDSYGLPKYLSMSAFLYGNGEKAESLESEINNLIFDAGYRVGVVVGKGLYIYKRKRLC